MFWQRNFLHSLTNDTSMPQNEVSDQLSGRNGGVNELGYRRLEGELNTFRAEFESLVAQTDAEGDTEGWIDRGQKLLQMADDALEQGNLQQGWNYYHAAKRLSIYGLKAVGDDAALQGEGRELLNEAENAPLGWRAEAVRERIAKADGTLREDLTVSDLQSAHQLLHEGYESIHRKRQHLQSQFRYLRIGGLLTILAFLLVAIGGAGSGLLPSPFLEFQTHNTAGSTPGNPADLVWFLVYIVLAGMLGASLFGLRSLRQQSVSTSTPQYLSGFQATVARIVVGAGSALAVFFFARSELLTIDAGGGLTQGPFLIAIAFAAGYSQRFVHATVEAVAGMAESETDTNGDS